MEIPFLKRSYPIAEQRSVSDCLSMRNVRWMPVGRGKPSLSHLRPEPAHWNHNLRSPSWPHINPLQQFPLTLQRAVPKAVGAVSSCLGSQGAICPRSCFQPSSLGLWLPAGPASLSPALTWAKVTYKCVALSTPNIWGLDRMFLLCPGIEGPCVGTATVISMGGERTPDMVAPGEHCQLNLGKDKPKPGSVKPLPQEVAPQASFCV